MNSFKNRLVIFLFCSIFAAGFGVKINDFGLLCKSHDKVREPYLITQSHFDQYFVKNIEPHNKCEFSRVTFQDELVQFKKINLNVYAFDTGNTEKINVLNDSFLSLTKPSNKSYSAIPIFLQKESFLT
ncbi:MAG TPA: hypothetical protein ENI15_07105 [Spirochaetes bacterium]|nr:hypothetical protein [Spirochaetota bacterium]